MVQPGYGRLSDKEEIAGSNPARPILGLRMLGSDPTTSMLGSDPTTSMVRWTSGKVVTLSR